jgi:hypothetical protein
MFIILIQNLAISKILCHTYTCGLVLYIAFCEYQGYLGTLLYTVYGIYLCYE